MASGRFIPASELRRLAEGCYEHVVSQVHSLVKENSSRLFGRQVEVDLVGTFPTSAFVLSEDGEVARVKFERAENGSLVLTGHEPVRVAAFSEDTVEDYARSQVRRAVRSWQEGRVSEAQRLIAEVAPYVDARPAKNDDKIVEALVTAYQASRPWRLLLKERRNSIYNVLGKTAVEQVLGSSPRPKFRLLHDGTLQESERIGYADLLQSDFGYLTTRVESLLDLVESHYGTLVRVIRSEEFKAEESITTLVSFTEDLISDLRRLTQITGDAPKQIMKIESLARLYDTLVAGFGEYEIAGQFIETMSKRLQEAA